MHVFLLAYANDNTDYLENLKEESSEIYKYTCRKAADRNFLPIKVESATINDINELLIDFSGLISVFLFSGHAGGNLLQFEKDIANAKGIAMHLQKSATAGVLKVVILNGCATKKAAKSFLDMGAPVVIVTNSKVGDKAATEFSKAFFKSACENGTNIADSFNIGLAAAKICDKNDLLDMHKKVRRLDDLDTIPDDKPLWEIFSKDENKTKEQIIPKVDKEQFKFRSYEKLLKTIFTSLFNAGCPQIIELWKSDEKATRNRFGFSGGAAKAVKEAAICSSIPMPIGSKLNRLLNLNMNVRGKDQTSVQLQRLVDLFQSTNEFLAITMVAQLWEVALECDSFTLAENIRQELSKYFNSPSDQRDAYPYEQLLFMIRDFMANGGHSDAAQAIISKQVILKDFLTLNKMDFQDSSVHFRSCSGQATLTDKNIQDAEDDLCTIFNMLGFLYRYNLVSVQSVEALRRRHEKKKAWFRHRTFRLNEVDLEDIRERKYENTTYLDSPGMLISIEIPPPGDHTGNEDKPNAGIPLDFLNLSPFIVDINAFEDKKDKARPMVYNGPQKDDMGNIIGYSYKESDDIDKVNLLIGDEKYDPVVSEIDAFKKIVIS